MSMSAEKAAEVVREIGPMECNSMPITRTRGWRLQFAPEICRADANCLFGMIELLKSNVYESIQIREDAELARQQPLACGFIHSAHRPQLRRVA